MKKVMKIAREKISSLREVESMIPNTPIGPKARAISEYLHYIGVSYLNIEKIFRDIFSLDVTSTSFINFDKKIAC